jgi:hypothetical protein
MANPSAAQNAAQLARLASARTTLEFHPHFADDLALQRRRDIMWPLNPSRSERAAGSGHAMLRAFSPVLAPQSWILEAEEQDRCRQVFRIAW